MIQLIPYLLAHTKYILPKDEVPLMIEYMDKFDFDKKAFGASIVDEYMFITLFVTEYLKHIDLSTEVVAGIPVDVIPAGFGKNVMNEMVKIINDAEKKSHLSKPKLTTVSLEDTIKISDSVATKAMHALRISSSKPRKKT
ncbi:MAG: hypothetical protein ACRD8W_09360 [Nitrososphaeraceae archaeon]